MKYIHVTGKIKLKLQLKMKYITGKIKLKLYILRCCKKFNTLLVVCEFNLN